jgi:phospholipid/cholesterol/gamma-HCH transport system ATP-binding protein
MNDAHDTDNAILELRDAGFSAQDKSIVSGISLTIQDGLTTALIGPSGGGKSTVLKLLAGLIVPTSGKALYRGADVSLMNRGANLDFRKRAAFVFQDSALWANQSLRQILEIPLQIHFPEMSQKKRTERIVEVLAETGYRKDLDIRPSQLSMGEQKLIAFARAMMCDPSILFLDEWTESLDDAGARRLIGIVKRKQNEGATVVFVSHNLRIIRELAAEICLIADGKLSLSASNEEFTHDENIAKIIEKGIAQ